jgi:RNA polymerase sigma-70 factor (ECF subfamily)
MRVRDPADRAAWSDFDRRYREWLIRFFRRRNVPFPDAEDLVQRVFSSLVVSLPQFTYDPNRGRFRDYLFRCARNALSEWARCPGRNGKALFNHGGLDSAVSSELDPAEAAAWEEEWIGHHYRLALESLRVMAAERDIAILERSMGGASVADLAREFAMEEAAVYKVRQRIRERMEALIAAQVADEDRTDV